MLANLRVSICLSMLLHIHVCKVAGMFSIGPLFSLRLFYSVRQTRTLDISVARVITTQMYAASKYMHDIYIYIPVEPAKPVGGSFKNIRTSVLFVFFVSFSLSLSRSLSFSLSFYFNVFFTFFSLFIRLFGH